METERLTLREVGSGDRALLVVLRTDEAVRRYLGGAMDAEVAAQRAEAMIVARPHGVFVAERRDTGESIGLVLLHSGHGGTEVSYQFLPACWKQGFAFEAVRCIIDHAVSEGIDELIAVTQTANEPSRRLLERLGMTACERFEEFGAQQTLYRLPRP